MKITNPILKQIWEDRYKKGNETIDDNIKRVAKYISKNDKEEQEFFNVMNQGLFFPAGRTMSNAGIGESLTLNNCFTLNLVPDSIEGIFDYVKYGAMTQKAGGGTGYNFSLIRPNGTPTKNDAVASGVVSFMDAFDSQTHTILQGGRRGANMGCLLIYHPDIEEFLESKSWDEGKLNHFNLSVLIDDEFMKAKNNNENITLRFPCMDERGNIINDLSQCTFTREIDANELWDKIMTKAYNTGEYGVLYYDNLNKDNNIKYMENIVGTNPCLRGDMKLLTIDGYKEIKDLENSEVAIINKDGDISISSVWCSGEKEIYKIKLSNKKELFTTADHRFMTINGDEVEAKDLKGMQLMPYLKENINEKNKTFELFGFIQGDGGLGRLKSTAHMGLEVNIGEKDNDISDYFGLQVDKGRCYLQGYNDILRELGFSAEQLPNRTLPTTFENWGYEDKVSFLRGMYSANGSVLSCGRVTYKTTCRKLADSLNNILKSFGMESYITINKKHDVEFSNGVYECKESYDVNIQRWDSKVKFYNTIGFIHKYKMNKLYYNLLKTSPTVINVLSTGDIEKVYDFTEPLTHWGVVEGFVLHNCGEYISGVLYNDEQVLDDYFGACNLGSLMLHRFIQNPFTDKACINYELLDSTIKTAVKMLDNIIDINNYPLKQFENYQKSIRTIGLGYTALADVMCMMNLVYGSKESIDFADELINHIVLTAYKCSCLLAKEYGSFKFLDKDKYLESNFIQKHMQSHKGWQHVTDMIKLYGIRNARIMSVAPTGTLSLTYGENCSSGIEPIFSLAYDRKVKIGGQDDKDIQIVSMEDYAYSKWLKFKDNKECNVNKNVFVTAMDLNVLSHIDVLEVVAYHTDMSVSKTINIPTDYSYQDTKSVYDLCWSKGIKGCTIFRPNPLRQGILIDSSKPQDDEIKEVQELKRGEWKSLAEDTIYLKKPLKIGCGNLKLFIGYSPSENNIQDLYIKKAGSGGCTHNLEAVAVALSAIYRLGGSTKNIEKAFSGLGGCNSFLQGRLTGKELSKGSSCATAILNILKDFEKELNLKPVTSQIIKDISKEDVKFSNEEIKYRDEYGYTAFAKRFNKCPICGEELQHTGGCLQCTCGYNKCE